jgi:hypothetical protein
MGSNIISRKIGRYIDRRRSLMPSPRNALAFKNADRSRFFDVTSPVALISQIQRSGGSLLSQLFDSHPQLHAHPHELKIGHPKKYLWPEIDLQQSPARWFDILFEESVIRHSREGYKKEPTSNLTFPFIFLPYAQKKIFLECIKKSGTVSLRDVFNAYMTSYFGAWLNNNNYDGDKKFVTAFTPRLSESATAMEKFFTIYPDGRLISILRDPKNWFPSALRHNKKIKKDKYSDIRIAIDQWKRNTEAINRNKERFKERVCVIKFEDLVQKTEQIMRHLSQFLQIEFHETLLVPTFNGSPIQANTSFKETGEGIVSNTVARHKTLSCGQIEFIERETLDLYSETLKQTVDPMRI